jgi:hypothetical protein
VTSVSAVTARAGVFLQENKYDQAKYFMVIYSDSAEMSRRMAFCVSVV